MTHTYHYPNLSAGLAAECPRCQQIVERGEVIDAEFGAPLSGAEIREALDMYRELRLSGVWTEAEAHTAGLRLLARNVRPMPDDRA